MKQPFLLFDGGAFSAFADEPPLPVGDVSMDSVIGGGSLFPNEPIVQTKMPTRAQMVSAAGRAPTRTEIEAAKPTTIPRIISGPAQAQVARPSGGVSYVNFMGQTLKMDPRAAVPPAVSYPGLPPNILAWFAFDQNGNTIHPARFLSEQAYHLPEMPAYLAKLRAMNVLSDSEYQRLGDEFHNYNNPPPPAPNVTSDTVRFASTNRAMPTAAPATTSTPSTGMSTTIVDTLGKVLQTAAVAGADYYKTRLDVKAAADIAKTRAQAELDAAKFAARQAKTGKGPIANPALLMTPGEASHSQGPGFLASLGFTKDGNYTVLVRNTAIALIVLAGVTYVIRMAKGRSSGRRAIAD